MDIRKCEYCGQLFVAGYGYCIAAAWYVTGSAFVESHMCDQVVGGQHWGCCPEHAVKSLENCLTNHLTIDNLMKRHVEAHRQTVQDGVDENGTPKFKEIQRPRYSDEHADIFKDAGDNFHHVTLIFNNAGKDTNGSH